MRLDLTPLEKALPALERGPARAAAAPGAEELRDACVQRFELTGKPAWKMLKHPLEPDLPNAAEVDAMSYRGLIRMGAAQGLIDDVTAWFIYRDKRNLRSHTCDPERAAEVYAILLAFACHCRGLQERLKAREDENA